MNDATNRPPVAGQVNRCPNCGYDRRGSDSERCPKCGTAKSIAVGIGDARQFHEARAALEARGLVQKAVNPGGTLGTVGTAYGMLPATGWLWVDQNRLDEVEAILDELGVVNSLGARPIVDRAEPNCPGCNATLDPAGAEICPSCGTAFQWVDFDGPQIDPSGLICPNCDYDLTGNTTDRCPECGQPVPANLEAMVEAAMSRGNNADDRDSSKSSSMAVHPRKPVRVSLILECACITALACILFAIAFNANQPTIAVVVLGLAIGAVIMKVVTRR